MLMTLACDNVEATRATQVRKELNKEIIDQYHEDLKNGAVFPPIDVFAEEGSERYILSDGFHRLLAHIHAGAEYIEVRLHLGGIHEALRFALGANTIHGLRRSNADKVNAVQMALKDPEIAQHTQQQIADICRVTRETVNRVGRRVGLYGDDDEDGSQEGGEPEENKPSNKRKTRPAPTQAETERAELRQAMSLVKALPYDGADTVKLELSSEDVDDLEYVSGWCAHAVLAYRE